MDDKPQQKFFPQNECERTKPHLLMSSPQKEFTVGSREHIIP